MRNALNQTIDCVRCFLDTTETVATTISDADLDTLPFAKVAIELDKCRTAAVSAMNFVISAMEPSIGQSTNNQTAEQGISRFHELQIIKTKVDALTSDLFTLSGIEWDVSDCDAISKAISLLEIAGRLIGLVSQEDSTGKSGSTF